MRFFLILCFTFFLTCSMEARERKPAAAQLTGISLIDRNGMSETIQAKERLETYTNVDFLKPQAYQKVRRNYARNKRGEVLSIITSYYPNGQIKQYLELVNNGAYGPYWEWHENGQPKLSAFVIGGSGDLGPSSEKSWLFEGTTNAWNEDGSPTCEIPYEKGTINGISNYYYPSGKLMKKVSMKEGKIDGLLEKYGKEGILLESISYSQGKRNGQSLIHYPEGGKAAVESYSEGMLDKGAYYDKNGVLIASVEAGEGRQACFEEGKLVALCAIVGGIPEGEVLQFDEEGSLFVKYVTRDGEKHGEEIEYYPPKKGKEPVPKLSINWFQGKIQGIVKTWFPNGRQESKREMSDNKKNGLLTAWYESGAIMLIEEYDADVLKKGTYFKKGDRVPVSEVKDGRGFATLFDAQGNVIKKIEYQQGCPKE